MSSNLILTVLLLTTATHSSKTNSAKEDLETNLEARFDELVDLNEIILSPEEKDYRLSLFTVNCLAETSGNTKQIRKRRQKKLCPGISIDSIYTSEELDQMEGAKMETNPPPEVHVNGDRQKREIEEIPSSYDVRDEIEVSKPTHQKTCGNCYIHTFVSALEIAHTLQTGQFVPFSRQELTDCYYSGCSGGDYRVVAHMMSVMDHLSTPSQYGPYLSQYTQKKFACKAGLTPDSLLDIKVKGYSKVSDSTLDHYLYKHGSVMTCLDWKGSESNNCGELQYVRDQVFKMKTGENAEPHGCSHAVLIVGYTPEYYIVKNSHGVSWGNGGYFKIERGNNACGIEDNMAVLITEQRQTPKNLAPNNCPVDKPKWCAESKSCTSSSYCLGVSAHTTSLSKRSAPGWKMYRSRVQQGGIHDIIRKKIEERRKSMEAAKKQATRTIDTDNAMVHYRASKSARDIKSFQFLDSRQQCVDQAGEARCAILKARGYCSTHLATKEIDCRKTCGLCWNPEQTECRDVSESCSQLSLPLCDILYRVRRNCPSRCNTCNLANPKQGESAVNWMPRQPAGPCNVPDIPNGRVVVPGGRRFLQSGEVLSVECEQGYTLTGEETKCVAQDVFSPDPRVLPACIKIEEEELQGNGEHYMGSKNVSASGRPCLSWNREVYRGSVFGNSIKIEELMNGNHHYCRNLGGSRAVPFCLVDMENTGVNSKSGKDELEDAMPHPDKTLKPKTELQFCFTHPGCDRCSAETTDYLGTDYCSQLAEDGMCDYMAMNAENQRTHIWSKCARSCCQAARCPLTD